MDPSWPSPSRGSRLLISSSTTSGRVRHRQVPNGETRMYVGVGGGGARLPPSVSRRSCVRPLPPQRRRSQRLRPLRCGRAGSISPRTFRTRPATRASAYCDPQCSYDSYVFAPARHFPNSGATADTVYLSGDNEYTENNWGLASPRCCFDNPATGRSNGRGVLLSTNGGAAPGTQYFTDMTDDDSHDLYPFELHPDHHALTVNPRNYKQFFDVGDGGIVRSNGKLIDDSGDCVQPKGYTATRAHVLPADAVERAGAAGGDEQGPQDALHFYQIDVSPFDNNTIVGGPRTTARGSAATGRDPAQTAVRLYCRPSALGIDADKFPSSRDCLGRGRGDDDDDDDNGNSGSGGEQIWVNTNIADGGHNGFDLGDPCFRLSGFQQGQTMVSYDPKNQLDMNWTSDTHFVLYGGEANAFIGVANDDHTVAARLLVGPRARIPLGQPGAEPRHDEAATPCSTATSGTGSGREESGTYDPPIDICDDWTPRRSRSERASDWPGRTGRRSAAATSASSSPHGTARRCGLRRRSAACWSRRTRAALRLAVVFDRIDDDASAGPTARTGSCRRDLRRPEGLESRVGRVQRLQRQRRRPPVMRSRFATCRVRRRSRSLDGNEPRDRLGDIPRRPSCHRQGHDLRRYRLRRDRKQRQRCVA